MLKSNFNNLLNLFGAESSRNSFIELCKSYYYERARQEALDEAGQAAFNSKSAEIHNQIMEIVQKLHIPISMIMPSRKEVGKMIMEHFRKVD